MPFCDYLSDNSTVRDIMANQAARYFPMETFTEDLMRGPSPLSVAERELIAALVSGLNACQFCFGAHLAGAEAFGVAPDRIQRLIDSPDEDDGDARIKPILDFVRKLTTDPSRVVTKDAEAVFEAGWDEQALHDAVAICALFNFYNRLVDGHGVKGDAAMFPMIGNLLRDKGYAPAPLPD